MPGAVLGAEDRVASETDQDTCLCGDQILMGTQMLKIISKLAV